MKINREELLGILNSVRPGLASREIVEQSTSFVFVEDHVITYNDLIAVSHPIEIDIDGAVKAQELLDLLNKMTEDEIDIKTEDKQVIIKGKRLEAGIAYASEISLPIDEVKSEKTWNKLPLEWANRGVKANFFVEAVEACLFSVAKSMARPELACVHITSSYVESSDGFRLTRYDGLKLPKAFRDGVLIPGNACPQLVNHNPIEVAVTERWVHFRNGSGSMFSCRTLNSDYINLDTFLEVEGPEIDIDGEALIPILDKAAIFSDKDTKDVEITIENNWTTIKGEGTSGWFKEKTRTKYKGEKIQFMISPKFLIDILQVVETIVVGTRDGVKHQKLLKFSTESVTHCCATYNALKKEE